MQTAEVAAGQQYAPAHCCQACICAEHPLRNCQQPWMGNQTGELRQHSQQVGQGQDAVVVVVAGCPLGKDGTSCRCRPAGF